MLFPKVLAFVGTVAAVQQGFNYGSTNNDGSPKQLQDFQNEFTRAKNLQGTSGFTSARLYTMIQANTANTPISAIQAAINTGTGLLLGLWASAGQSNIDNEIIALKQAIEQHGSAFVDLIECISVGSEDLYRNSPTGIINKSGAGANPDDLVNYIQQVRNAIANTPAAGKSIGHVDTWTTWVNGSNSAVVSAVDWLGFDGYPYFQNTQANGIENGAQLLFESYNATVAASQGKPVWITETGWPVSGPTENQAVASPENAARYWQDVACRVLGNIPTYWYTLQDAYPFTPSPSFGIVGSDLNSAPLYDLSCKNGNASPSSSPSSSIVATATPVAASSGATSETPASTFSLATAPGVGSSAAPTSTPAATVAASSTAGSDGKTFTAYSTTLITVTSCPSSCAPHTGIATATVTSKTVTPPSTSSCPTNLNGPYEFPHLIVPVDSANPSKAYGTSYNGTINPSVSSIFNFDIPASYAGKTCSLVFLFPELSHLETSSYSFNNQGGLAVTGLVSPATEQTSFDSVPASNGQKGSIESVVPGNGYSILTQECPAGQRISFEFSSVGGLDVNFFQDYNPSPLGVYVTVC